MKFQVPFEVMVVFSTNLNPNSLADEAFLRRIQTKVEVEEVDNEIFDRITRRVLETHKVTAENGCVDYLRETCRMAAGGKLHACYPGDIYRLVKSISEYEGRAVRLTRVNIERAAALYFAKA
jgi:hypothetical protein